MNPGPISATEEARQRSPRGGPSEGERPLPRVIPLSEETCPCRPLSLAEVGTTLRDHPTSLMYLLASGAALLIVTLYFLEFAEGWAMLFPLLGLLGWIRLWGGAAGVVLLLGCWLSYFPLGLPNPDERPIGRPVESGWDPLPNLDLFLAVLAMLTYVYCQWRYVSLMRGALGPIASGDQEPLGWRRPAQIVPAYEWLVGIGQAAGAAAVAWVLGIVAHSVVLVPGYDPPFAWSWESLLGYPEALPEWLSRLILLSAVAAWVVAVSGGILWLLRHRRLNPDEAALLLQEHAWEQLHREWRRFVTFQRRFPSRSRRAEEDVPSSSSSSAGRTRTRRV